MYRKSTVSNYHLRSLKACLCHQPTSKTTSYNLQQSHRQTERYCVLNRHSLFLICVDTLSSLRAVQLTCFGHNSLGVITDQTWSQLARCSHSLGVVTINPLVATRQVWSLTRYGHNSLGVVTTHQVWSQYYGWSLSRYGHNSLGMVTHQVWSQLNRCGH